MTIADINSEARLLTDTDTTSYTAANLLRRINTAYEEIIGLLIDADGVWQFDDSNFTDHPRGTGTLVAGQEDYKFNSEYLQIEAIDILDASSPATYRRIKQIDHQLLKGMSPEEYFGLTSAGNPLTGMPEYYDVKGRTIRLYPAPIAANVTLTDGIMVWFKRTADLFTTAQVTTGTKQPGFASPYHIILAYMAAIPYCMAYKKDRVALYERKVAQLKDGLIKHYSERNKDFVPRLTMRKSVYR